MNKNIDLSSLDINNWQNSDNHLHSQIEVTPLHDEKTDTHMHLWNAVILQAITDATTNYKRTENRVEKIRATTWLLQNNADFLFVCHLAGQSAPYVRAKARAVIEKIKIKELRIPKKTPKKPHTTMPKEPY